MKRAPRDKIELVRQLLSAGVSQREASRTSGLSRWITRRVLRGVYDEFDREDEDRRRRYQFTGHRPGQPAYRCGGCGALVRGPCLACLTRGELEAGVDRRDAGVLGDGDLSLKLTNGTAARYRRMLERRRQVESGGRVRSMYALANEELDEEDGGVREPTDEELNREEQES